MATMLMLDEFEKHCDFLYLLAGKKTKLEPKIGQDRRKRLCNCATIPALCRVKNKLETLSDTAAT